MIFNVVIDWIMRSVDAPTFHVTNNLCNSDFAYADDIALLANNEREAQKFLNDVAFASAKLALQINASKTKIVHFNNPNPKIFLDNQRIETVDAFIYLGSNITGTTISTTQEVVNRIGKAYYTFAKLEKHLWSRSEISLGTKIQVFKCLVLSVLLYASETWTLLATDLAKLEVFQMKCLRRILRKSCHCVSNKEVRDLCKIDAIEKTIRKRRLKWFGHVCRMGPDRIPPRVLLDDRPQSWKCPRNAPKKTWKDQVLVDMKPLHFRNLGEAVDAAYNRSPWRGVIRDVMGAATSGSGSLPYRR